MAKREFSAGGIIVKGDGENLRILLIRDGYGRWTWPKGNIREGETSRRAAIREIGEEVGLKKLRMIKKIRDIQYYYRLKGTLIFKKVTLFLFKLTGRDSIKVQESEIQDARWFEPEEAINKVEYKGADKILEAAISTYKNYIGNGSCRRKER